MPTIPPGAIVIFISVLVTGIVVVYALLLAGQFDSVIDRDTVSATGGPVIPAVPAPPVCTTANCDNVKIKDKYVDCLAKGGSAADCNEHHEDCITTKCSE